MFKECTSCGRPWNTREDFLEDRNVALVGYQAIYLELTAGLFLFNHLEVGCLTTLAIPAALFWDLYEGAIFEERLLNTPRCAGHCLHSDDLKPCPNKCECAFVREILQIVKAWHKRQDHETG